MDVFEGVCVYIPSVGSSLWLVEMGKDGGGAFGLGAGCLIFENLLIP